ncbi:hypothetical protein RHIZ404_200379 [Rhizobium sp. EC-SD404]|nr:hypothetical protein RHIZ404_200379 [Rhizobium sp. EC-SD404]
MVAGNIAVMPAKGATRHLRKRIPDGRPPSIRLRCPFDLERGGRNTEEEIGRDPGGESFCRCHKGFLEVRTSTSRDLASGLDERNYHWVMRYSTQSGPVSGAAALFRSAAASDQNGLSG